MATTVRDLLQKMEELYWTSAHREVCNMMLFFLEMQDKLDAFGAQNVFPECENFESMFKVWSKSLNQLQSSQYRGNMLILGA